MLDSVENVDNNSVDDEIDNAQNFFIFECTYKIWKY